MLHSQSRRALELWAEGPQVTDPDFGADELAAMRQRARAVAVDEPREPVHRVEDLDADGVRCRLYAHDEPAAAGPVLIFLHGGGFVFGDLDTHDGQCRRLANRTGLAVLAADYRRPPEHRFPAAPDDVDTVLRWLAREGTARGLDAARIGFVGDSAGGNLALVAALRNPGAAAAVVLVYPFLDPGLSGASYTGNDGGGLTRAEARWYWEQYAGTAGDLRDTDLAPLLAPTDRFARLRAPVLVQLAEHDPLVDENHALVARLEAAGVAVRATTYPGMVHGFWRHPALFDAAEVALAEIADFVVRSV